MKNFFTGVKLPRGGRGEVGECIAALSELVAQLRVTVNSIDLENMTPELRGRISGTPRFNYVKSTENVPYKDLEKGDIVIVYEETSGLSKVTEMYLYTGEGLI